MLFTKYFIVNCHLGGPQMLFCTPVFYFQIVNSIIPSHRYRFMYYPFLLEAKLLSEGLTQFPVKIMIGITMCGYSDSR